MGMFITKNTTDATLLTLVNGKWFEQYYNVLTREECDKLLVDNCGYTAQEARECNKEIEELYEECNYGTVIGWAFLKDEYEDEDGEHDGLAIYKYKDSIGLGYSMGGRGREFRVYGVDEDSFKAYVLGEDDDEWHVGSTD